MSRNKNPLNKFEKILIGHIVLRKLLEILCSKEELKTFWNAMLLKTSTSAIFKAWIWYWPASSITLNQRLKHMEYFASSSIQYVVFISTVNLNLYRFSLMLCPYRQNLKITSAIFVWCVPIISRPINIDFHDLLTVGYLITHFHSTLGAISFNLLRFYQVKMEFYLSNLLESFYLL